MEKLLRSQTEREVYWWIEELIEKGFIDKVEYETVTFKLFEGASYIQEKQLKTKTKKVTRSLLQACEYTPDFVIHWNKKAVGKICSVETFDTPIWCNKELISYFEVKPSFDHQNKRQFASLNIKWVYQKYGEYVQIIIPHEPPKGRKHFLFKDTFTPEKYLKTKTGKWRKIHWKVNLISKFLKL